MKDTKYVVYTCDEHHTHSSKQVISVCSSMKAAISVIELKARSEGETLSDDDKYMLEKHMQTQSYEGEGQFIVEEYLQNTLN